MSAGVVGEGRHIAVTNVVMQQNKNAIVNLKKYINNPQKDEKPAVMPSVGDDFTVIKKTRLMLVPHP